MVDDLFLGRWKQIWDLNYIRFIQTNLSTVFLVMLLLHMIKHQLLNIKTEIRKVEFWAFFLILFTTVFFSVIEHMNQIFNIVNVWCISGFHDVLISGIFRTLTSSWLWLIWSRLGLDNWLVLIGTCMFISFLRLNSLLFLNILSFEEIILFW